MSVLPHGGGGGGAGWVGLAEFQGGWVSNPPPPPGVGWDFVGALGSIELVPLLSFFCCRFHVTCLFMVCLHGIAYHVCMPHAHKGARMQAARIGSNKGRWSTKGELLVFRDCDENFLPHVGGWVGGWVGVRPPPPRGGGVGTFVGLWVCQNSGWVGP